MLIVVFLDIEVNVPKGEAGHRITRLEVFHKKGFLLKLKNSVSLFLGDFIKQCTLAQLFSCEFYEIFKIMFSIRHLNRLHPFMQSVYIWMFHDILNEICLLSSFDFFFNVLLFI